MSQGVVRNLACLGFMFLGLGFSESEWLSVLDKIKSWGCRVGPRELPSPG